MLPAPRRETPGPKPMLPYGRRTVTDDDIRLVVEVLQSDWRTAGPTVERFERAVADYVGAAHAVAVSSGTAALHAAMFALGIGPGDEVIVPAMTFAATANSVVYQRATPVFADVDPDSLLLDPAEVERRITPRTRAIVAVDFAGQPCDYRALRAVAEEHQLALVADASHAMGAGTPEGKVGSLADLTAFSLHSDHPITTGEGGMITGNDGTLAELMRRFRNHGFSRDHRERSLVGSWYYEMTDLGYNYRLSDVQCALGMSQLAKLEGWLERRREIARRYDEAFEGLAAVRPLMVRRDVTHAWHLYVVRLDREVLALGRTAVFDALRAKGIGAGVHYIPVHLHPFYRERFGTGPGLCPKAEAAYEGILSLPIFPAMSDADVGRVIAAVESVVTKGTR